MLLRRPWSSYSQPQGPKIQLSTSTPGFCGAGDQTQNLMHARQAFCPLSCIPSLSGTIFCPDLEDMHSTRCGKGGLSSCSTHSMTHLLPQILLPTCSVGRYAGSFPGYETLEFSLFRDWARSRHADVCVTRIYEQINEWNAWETEGIWDMSPVTF